MYLPNNVLWCFVFLFVASSLESEEHSINGDKQSDSSTVQYDLFASSMKYQNKEIKSTRDISRENFIKNNDKIKYESYINSTKNERKDDVLKQYESRGRIIKYCEESNHISMGSTTNSTDVNDSMIQKIKNFSRIERESNSTLHKNGNSNKNTENPKNIDNISYDMCHNITCVQLCCPVQNFIEITGKCIANESRTYLFPKIYKYKDGPDYPVFFTAFHDPCFSQGYGKSFLPSNEYYLLTNGSLYHDGKFISPTSYCLVSFKTEIYEVMVCNNQTMYPIYISMCLLVSLPFLLVTFVVYSILPELQNMHGYTLRAHIASLFIAYVILYCGQQVSKLQQVDDKICCITLAYILNFFLLSTFFWLNVTCFDIWWKFRELRSYQINIRQQKNKFKVYSIYAWGIPLILTIICATADNVDEIATDWKPQICTKQFWFGGNLGKTIYFYVPMSATIISNICFFIATTLSIMYQNIRTAKQLRHSESMCYNENKQSFKIYLKLFIVMGISWIMEILASLIDDVPSYVWYPTNVLNSLQGIIIFIIFVCRKKIKQQLLKRYGGQNCGPFGNIPIYNDRTSSNITTTSTLGTEPMQEMNSIN